MAKSLSQRLPLPRQCLSDLTSKELRELCTRHQDSINNLSLHEPKVRRSKIVYLPSDGIESPPVLFSSIFGGRQALIVFESGLFQLRDLHHEQPAKPRDSGKCYAVENNEQGGNEPAEVGEVLASFQLRGEAWDYDYEFGSDGSIVFAIAIQSR